MNYTNLRALYDANTQEGVDNVVATFTFEEHKMHAARILQSVYEFQLSIKY